MAARNLEYEVVTFLPSQSLRKPYKHSAAYLSGPLNDTFRQQLGETRPFTTQYDGDYRRCAVSK